MEYYSMYSKLSQVGMFNDMYPLKGRAKWPILRYSQCFHEDFGKYKFAQNTCLSYSNMQKFCPNPHKFARNAGKMSNIT